MLSFGTRLQSALSARGRLCVGIDPHSALLESWGLSDDVTGLEAFSRTVVDALGGQVAVFKPQVAFFERFGSRGLAVLEATIADARSQGALVLNDAKRGDIGTTMAAYARAWLYPDSPLAGDAVTLSPFLGLGSLDPALEAVLETGNGVFVLALTSNPEGAAVQHAETPLGTTVGGEILRELAQRNAAELGTEIGAGGTAMGSFGAVVGATIGAAGRFAAGDDLNTGGPLLAPGLGAQGASATDLATLFGDARPFVLPAASREILQHGPKAADLQWAVRRMADDCERALSSD